VIASSTLLESKENSGELTLDESNQLIKVQRDILEIVVTGNDYQHALNSLCRTTEGIVDDAVASIMVYDDNKTELLVRAAPNVAEQIILELNGMVSGPNQGSCGTAVFKKTPQFVKDTSTDKRWQGLRSLASNCGIHACWSMPIVGADNEVIGSFALSSFCKRAPNKFQKNLLRTASYLASLVLRREQEANILQQAAHSDYLTELPNRNLFVKRVDQAVARVSRCSAPLAVFFIDLDNFKQVNDEYGHEAGDRVLKDVATRLQSKVRKEDTLARLGGDEFVLLVEDMKDVGELRLIANKMLEVLDAPFDHGSKQYYITASVGISIYPINGLSTCELLRCADKAMYIAKSLKKDKIQFYSA